MGDAALNPLPRGFSAPIPLGFGGEGQAVLCWQDDPGRWVVLKSTTPSGRNRLRREAAQLSRLAGGPVPAVISQDLSGRRPWIALTWIDGLPLDEIPADLSVPDRRALVLQAALAVARLHGAKVVHGDLSAGNLIARPHGEIALIDFGLSPDTDGSIPPVEGTWEILPPERLQGGAPDPRWDVFALGVLGLRLLDALPPEADSRDGWSRSVASGDAATWARGRSWALAQALDPDPKRRPEDAAALVRLLEKDWGDPPLTRGFIQLASNERMERLLSTAVEHARQRRDWNSAWQLQRERIERSSDPQELLADLGAFQRLRSSVRSPSLPWMVAAGIALMLSGIGVFWLASRTSDRPFGLEPEDPSERQITDYEGGSPASFADVLVLDPPPGGSVLRIDGKIRPTPGDGFLRLAPGSHRVELADSSGEIILDTTWTVPRHPHPRRRPKAPVESTATSPEKGTP
jgi:serine/threonine protein kinase